MRRGTLTLLIFIILLAAGASFVDFWPNQPGYGGVANPFTISQGVDLAGGLRLLLAPKSGHPTDQDMQNTLQIVQSRLSGGLGVKELDIRLLHTQQQPTISIEMPSFSGDEQQTINGLLKTGMLEFWILVQAGISHQEQRLILHSTSSIIQEASLSSQVMISILTSLASPNPNQVALVTRSTLLCKALLSPDLVATQLTILAMLLQLRWTDKSSHHRLFKAKFLVVGRLQETLPTVMLRTSSMS